MRDGLFPTPPFPPLTITAHSARVTEETIKQTLSLNQMKAWGLSLMDQFVVRRLFIVLNAANGFFYEGRKMSY